MKKILSFDAETNGLWGKPFAIAAIVYVDGEETNTFIGRCPIEGPTLPWVAENVIPTLHGVDENFTDYLSLLKGFCDFYLANKNDATVIVHMGCPVETSIFKDAHSAGFLGDWDAPYPLLDIAGNLSQAGEDPTSPDSYVKKHNLSISDYGTTHNPLYDCEVAARVFIHLQK